MTHFFSTLRGRLVLITLLATAPVYGMLIGDYFQDRRRRVEETRMDALRAAELIAQRQEERILVTPTLLATLAQVPEVRARVEGVQNEACDVTLASAREEFGSYTSFVLSDIAGDSVCSEPALGQPIDSSDRTWFQSVVRNNDFSIGDYQIGRITGREVLVAAHPVRNRSGMVRGVLAAAIDLGGLAYIAGEIALPAESIVMILDREGTALARQPPAEGTVGRRHPAIGTVLTSQGNRGTSVTRGVDGVTRLYAFFPMRERSRVFGFVLVGIRDDLAFAAVNRDLIRDLLLLVVVTCISVAAVVVVSRNLILQKSAALVALSNRLAQEDFSARSGMPHGPDEFGQLAGALDRLAEELQARRVALEKSHERERQLELELRQFQKMEALGSLVGGVAHDFNNMLTAVNGNIQLVMQDVDRDSDVAACLREVLEVTDRCSTLTRQLLTFSRKQERKPTILSLNEVIEGLAKMLTRLIGPQAELRFAGVEDLWSVSADRGQLEQVILNLVINARDAMPGGGAILVETRNASLDGAYASRHLEIKEGRYVMLAVTDSGHGMDDATRERIFEPFFTTKKDQGTGLGLATVYGIVKQHGGAIFVYSEVGVGTSFKIYLPRADAPDVGVAARAPEVLPIPGAVSRGGILIVEDQEPIRVLVQRVLEAAGYNVIVAGDANEAEALFLHNPQIELLVADYIMPGRTGLELYKDLARHRPTIRALFMSGYTDLGVVQNGGLKESSFLSKPFSPSELLEKVRSLVANRLP